MNSKFPERETSEKVFLNHLAGMWVMLIDLYLSNKKSTDTNSIDWESRQGIYPKEMRRKLKTERGDVWFPVIHGRSLAVVTLILTICHEKKLKN